MQVKHSLALLTYSVFSTKLIMYLVQRWLAYSVFSTKVTTIMKNQDSRFYLQLIYDLMMILNKYYLLSGYESPYQESEAGRLTESRFDDWG